MSEILIAESTGKQEPRQTLWHCHRCAALICIYSAAIIESPICPSCCDVTLDQRGSFETILGMTSPER